jgi:hypothetical protein
MKKLGERLEVDLTWFVPQSPHVFKHIEYWVKATVVRAEEGGCSVRCDPPYSDRELPLFESDSPRIHRPLPLLDQFAEEI